MFFYYKSSFSGDGEAEAEAESLSPDRIDPTTTTQIPRSIKGIIIILTS